MTRADAEVFRRFHEAWTAGDLPSVRALVDPDVVARPLHGVLYTRTEYVGPDGIVDWYHEMTDPWERFEARVEDVHETRRGELVGVLRLIGHRSDDRLHARVAVAFEVRDGRLLSLTARDVDDHEAGLGRRI